jgi:hypothetical protein
MRTLFRGAICAVVVICLNSVVARFSDATSTLHGHGVIKESENTTREEALRIWEQAITAKGGRERIYAVRNAVISTTGTYRTSRGRKNSIRGEELYVFPNRFWSWSDYRPDVFGLRVEMVNYDTNSHYIITPDSPRDEPGRGMPSVGNHIMDGQLFYLLETKWVRPVLVSATAGTVGSHRVDIVQTKVNDQRNDFVFDRNSHLLIQLRAYHRRDNNEVLDSTMNLSGYAEVSGLQVPTKVTYEGGIESVMSFQFNVDYNESIFSTPPPIEAGSQAWRPKR